VIVASDIYHMLMYLYIQIPDDLYIRCILWLYKSAIYISPVVGSIATPRGLLSLAEVANPPSPL
jgi:hypothetical protein